MESRIALLDMDGTVADYVGQMERDLALLAAPDECEYPIWDAPSHIENRMRLIKKQPGWWLGLPRYEPGFEILEVLLSIGFKILVLTKGPSNTTSAWTEKVEWCHKHLPKRVKTIITEDTKDVVFGRVLVDDYVPFMEAWLRYRPRELGIMPAAPENQTFTHEQVRHYDGTNMERIRERLQWAFNREDGKS